MMTRRLCAARAFCRAARFLPRRAPLFAAFCLAFVLTACADKKAEWLNDFDSAQELAKAKNRNIFLFLSGDDWDEKSATLKETVINSDDILLAIGKTYVPVKLDFSQSLYEAAAAGEDASEAQAAEAGRIQALLEKNSDVAAKYSVSGLPAFYLLTKEGYVFAVLNPAGESGVAEFVALIRESDGTAEKINGLVKKIAKAKGAKKVEAIDELFESLDPAYRHLLADYFPLAAENDPENTTGLLGKYELQNAYQKATDYFSSGSPALASDTFVQLAEAAYLSDKERQEALYLAAFFLANSPEATKEGLLGLLGRSLDAAPQSEMAPNIQQIIVQITQENEAD
jgi:thioredoxin-related protein